MTSCAAGHDGVASTDRSRFRDIFQSAKIFFVWPSAGPVGFGSNVRTIIYYAFSEEIDRTRVYTRCLIIYDIHARLSTIYSPGAVYTKQTEWYLAYYYYIMYYYNRRRIVLHIIIIILLFGTFRVCCDVRGYPYVLYPY